MPTSRPRLSPLLLALAATVGVCAMGNVASACTGPGQARAQAQAGRGCCVDRKMPPDCACCDPGRAQPAKGLASRGVAAVSPPSADPGRLSGSCECRLDAPSAPARPTAPKAESPRHDRPEVEADPLAGVALVSPRRLAPKGLALRREAPSRTALYLRTSRLLI